MIFRRFKTINAQVCVAKSKRTHTNIKLVFCHLLPLSLSLLLSVPPASPLSCFNALPVKKRNRFDIFFLVSFFFFYFYCFLDRTTIREQTGDNLGRYIPFHSQFEFKAIQKLVESQKVPLIQSIPFQQAPNGECACVLFMCHPFIKLL